MRLTSKGRYAVTAMLDVAFLSVRVFPFLTWSSFSRAYAKMAWLRVFVVRAVVIC